jgi:hypothetical protein
MRRFYKSCEKQFGVNMNTFQILKLYIKILLYPLKIIQMGQFISGASEKSFSDKYVYPHKNALNNNYFEGRVSELTDEQVQLLSSIFIKDMHDIIFHDTMSIIDKNLEQTLKQDYGKLHPSLSQFIYQDSYLYKDPVDIDVGIGYFAQCIYAFFLAIAKNNNLMLVNSLEVVTKILEGAFKHFSEIILELDTLLPPLFVQQQQNIVSYNKTESLELLVDDNTIDQSSPPPPEIVV